MTCLGRFFCINEIKNAFDQPSQKSNQIQKALFQNEKEMIFFKALSFKMKKIIKNKSKLPSLSQLQRIVKIIIWNFRSHHEKRSEEMEFSTRKDWITHYIYNNNPCVYTILNVIRIHGECKSWKEFEK